jgi:hypothetical protein
VDKLNGDMGVDKFLSFNTCVRAGQTWCRCCGYPLRRNVDGWVAGREITYTEQISQRKFVCFHYGQEFDRQRGV